MAIYIANVSNKWYHILARQHDFWKIILTLENIFFYYQIFVYKDNNSLKLWGEIFSNKERIIFDSLNRIWDDKFFGKKAIVESSSTYGFYTFAQGEMGEFSTTIECIYN